MQLPSLTDEEQRQMQEKFNRIINRVIERLDAPLSTSNHTVERINAKLGIPPDNTPTPTSQNPNTQVIYETVSKAERLYLSLVKIEQELNNRSSPGGYGSVQNHQQAMLEPSSSVARHPHEIGRLNRLDSMERAMVVSYSDLKDPSREKGVDYTVMGVTTTKSAHKVEKKEEEQWDKPQDRRASVVPWNSRMPITINVHISKLRWFIGETLVFDIEMTNETTKKIKQVTLVLIKRKREYELKGQGLLALDLKKEIVVTELMVVPTGFPVLARKKHRGKVNFKLPFGMDPTTSGWIYYVQVRGGVPRHGGPTVILGPMNFEKRLLD